MKTDPKKLEEALVMFENGYSRRKIKETLHLCSKKLNEYLISKVGEKAIKQNERFQKRKAAIKSIGDRFGTTNFQRYNRDKKIYEKRQEGLKFRELAKMFHLTEAQVCRIVNDERMKEIQRREQEKKEWLAEQEENERKIAETQRKRKEQAEMRMLRIKEIEQQNKEKNTAAKADLLYKKMMRFAKEGNTQKFIETRNEYVAIQMRMEFEENMKNESTRELAAAKSLAKDINIPIYE